MSFNQSNHHANRLSSNTAQHIVSNNIHYYDQKWKKYKRPLSYSGWNWAAFLITPFWLAYRHMYVWTIAFFLFYLVGVFINSFFPFLQYYGYLPSIFGQTWNVIFPVLIHTFFGLKGNAFYAKRVVNLVELKENSSNKPVPPLLAQTGRSWVSATITPFATLIILLFPIQYINDWTFNPSLSYGTYVYSDDNQAPQGVLDVEEQPTFEKYNARINFLYYGEEEVGDHPFQVTLLHRSSNDENWESIRERSYSFFSSNRVTLDLIDAEDPMTQVGYYRLEIYIDNNLKGEEEFQITM